MCDAEGKQTLQRGMNYRLNPHYSLFLMSQRNNAPYNDHVHEDGLTIEYEGHDVMRQGYQHDPKSEDQPEKTYRGTLTENGKFINAVKELKNGSREPEIVKIYEKIMDGVWSLKGYFQLVDYKVTHDGRRNVFRFVLKLTQYYQSIDSQFRNVELSNNRVIPSEVKKDVWKRDEGKCVLCGSNQNLHFDHELPFSRGGTSLTALNVRLLCLKHNLEKSDKIQ